MAHPFNFSNWEAEAGGSRFKASPANLVSSRRAKAIETPCPKIKRGGGRVKRGIRVRAVCTDAHL